MDDRLFLLVDQLSKSIDDHSTSVLNASGGLQTRIDRSADQIVDAANTNIRLLVASLDNAAGAARAAAAASDRVARRLVWATWALVLATLLLVAITALHGP